MYVYIVLVEVLINAYEYTTSTIPYCMLLKFEIQKLLLYSSSLYRHRKLYVDGAIACIYRKKKNGIPLTHSISIGRWIDG
jgi:hypothetical protein